MNGIIQKLKNHLGDYIFPVTSTKCVYMEDGTTLLKDKLNSVDINIGNKSQLTTQNKSDLVNAINENVSNLNNIVQQNLPLKVDKVTGKGLSTNDYDNTEKSQVALVVNKADKTYVDTLVASQASGSPKNTFATLALLQADTTANTTDGKKYIYVVTADGKWYYWSGSAWLAGGVYQSSGIADSSATSIKRTAIGDWGVMNCDNNAYVNFDFVNGLVEFNKSATSIKRIRVHHRNVALDIGTQGITDTVAFDKTNGTRYALTFNISTRAINVYTQSTLVNITESEVLLAVWIGSDPTSVFCNVNNLKINNIPSITSNKRSVLGEIGLVSITSTTLPNFNFISGKLELPTGEKTVFWRNSTYDLSVDAIEIDITTPVDSNSNILFFDTSDKTFKLIRKNASYTTSVTENMVMVGTITKVTSTTGVASLFGNIVTVNGVLNIPLTPSPVIPAENSVYGIRYALNNSNPACERVYGSIGLSANISVNNAVTVNDFDNVYPWSEMKICNVSKTTWGATNITYKGESGFALDGTNGDVMVEIPKHYIRRYRKDGYEYILISGTPKDGFTLEPSFMENGKELEKVYVGRYSGYVENDALLHSITGVTPRGSKSLEQFITYAKAKGTGYYELDWRTVMMIQRLFLVEFATKNSQSIMGGITRTVYFGKTECYAQISETQANRIIILKGTESEKFRVGLEVAVTSSQTVVDSKIITAKNDYSSTQYEIVFSGTPVNTVVGVTQICSIPQKNGKTDYITYPSGREAGDIDKTACMYRGIENFWGNIWENVADIKINQRVVYFSNNLNDVQSQMLSFKVPLQTSIPASTSTVVFAKEMGYDSLNPNVMLPVTVGTTTVGQDGWCDGFYSYDTEQTAVFGGGWDHYDRAGLFAWRFWSDTTQKSWLQGGRLIFKPI